MNRTQRRAQARADGRLGSTALPPPTSDDSLGGLIAMTQQVVAVRMESRPAGVPRPVYVACDQDVTDERLAAALRALADALAPPGVSP